MTKEEKEKIITTAQMTLKEKQFLFMRLLPKLINKAHELGFELTGGDLWSKPECKSHKANSNHYIRLAIDLNLFRNGIYLTSTEDHRPLGEYWESLHPLCRWGGRFQDGNHYSIEHDGKM